MTDRYENIRKALAMGPTPGRGVFSGSSRLGQIWSIALGSTNEN